MNEFIGFCQDLVRIKSLSGQEGKLAQRVAQEMQRLGYDEVRVDAWGNVIGTVYGSSPYSLLYEGHMDTVDVSNPKKWTVDPFGGVVLDGKLYGRGSADMKGALAAMIYGIGDVLQTQEKPFYTLYVVAVVFEEIFEGLALGHVLDSVHPNAVILGEPSNLALCIGQKGRAEILLETFGKNAHSALPESGINAVKSMRQLLDAIDNLPVESNSALGEGIRVVTDIHSTPYPGASVLPDYCKVSLDLRLLETEKRHSVIGKFEECLEILRRGNPDFSASVRIASEKKEGYTGKIMGSERFYPGWLLEASSPLLEEVKQVYKSHKMDPHITSYPFCTDGSESAGKRGIPTIGIGPAPPSMAHQVDESVCLSDLKCVRNLYAAIALRQGVL